MKGFDSAQSVSGIIPKITASGCGFVARYYSRNRRKNLTAGEATALSNAGIAIVTVWEAAGDHLAAFTAATGHLDAIDAMRCAIEVDQPAGTTIFFAVDLDVGASDIATHILPYFAAVKAALADRYTVGVYGSGTVCAALKQHDLVTHTWLGGAMGWGGSRGYTAWDIRQGLPGDPYGFGFQIDPDEARGDNYGQWTLAAAVAPSAPALSPKPTLADFIALAMQVQTQLALLGYYPGSVDGALGEITSRAAMRAWQDWKGQA